MTFRKFGKTALTAALSLAIAFSLTSCIRSFTVGYLYVTGTVTTTPSGNGIITGFKINNDNGKLTAINGLPIGSGGANPIRAVLLNGGNFVYVLNQGATASGGNVCTATDLCPASNITEFEVGGNGILTPQETTNTQGNNPFRLNTKGRMQRALHSSQRYQGGREQQRANSNSPRALCMWKLTFCSSSGVKAPGVTDLTTVKPFSVQNLRTAFNGTRASRSPE